jgi:hypothetical protein
MSKLCWPDGNGKRYCVNFEEFQEVKEIFLLDVWEEEYPTKFCKTYEENIKNESDLSGKPSTSKQT